MPAKKTFIAILLGNIIEYYDFMLFLHLGMIITPLFFPNNSSTTVHLISLLLFGLAFFMRPLGGWIFGKVGDQKGRKAALVSSVFWSIFPTMGLALLPTYASIGLIAPLLFAFFRLSQGVALGGEYPNVGTYFMEGESHRRALFSGIIAASGSIGSLIGFGIAFYCIQESAPSWSWRAAFVLAALASIGSFFLRTFILEKPILHQIHPVIEQYVDPFLNHKRLLTTLIGIGAGTTYWLAISYSNFYLTKILHLDMSYGLLAAFIGIAGYILLTPFCGFIADKIGIYRFLRYTALAVCPLVILFFYWLTQGLIWPAQIGLTILASATSAPSHALMNQLFPSRIRGRNVALFFMLGLSIGGILPSVSGYIVTVTGYDLTPALMCATLSFYAFIVFSMPVSRAVFNDAPFSGELQEANS